MEVAAIIKLIDTRLGYKLEEKLFDFNIEIEKKVEFGIGKLCGQMIDSKVEQMKQDL